MEKVIVDKDVYSWMSTASFPGNVREARMVMAHEQMQLRLDTIMAE